MNELIEEFIKHAEKIEDLELYIFLILSLFTLWFIRNTIRYYKSEKKKVKLLHRFAKEGEVDSQCQLARRFQKGNAVKKSCKQAAFWYHKAAYSGDEKAQEHLKLFLEKQKRSRDKKKC